MSDLNIIKIDSLEMPELKVYTTQAEVQLLRMNEPDPGMFLAESPKVINRAMDDGYIPVSFLVDEKYLQGDSAHSASVLETIRRGKDLPIYAAGIDLLENLTGFHLTSGLVCAMKRRPLPSMQEVCQGAKRIALLEDITNPTNVGAIFRSAAALNMDAVLLTRDCSDPLYRRAIRVSMGTVFQIPWTIFGKRLTYPQAVLDELSSCGFKTAAMVLDKDSVDIDDEKLMQEEKLVIVLGAEGDGLKEDTIANCDYKVSIPMSHGVDSLNVAAASAVAFWQLGNN